MKRNFFTYKLLPILSILILISFVFINSCFAYSEEVVYNNTTYTFYIPDSAYNVITKMDEYKSGNYNYFMSCGNGQVYFYFIPKSFKLKIWLNGSTIKYSNNINDIENFYCIYYTIPEGGGTPSLQSNSYHTISNTCYSSGNKLYLLTNISVYSNSSCSDFFLNAPLTLAEILEVTSPVEMFQTLMKKLVVSLLVFLIGLIGLRKAWTFLKTALHKA